MGNFSSQHPYVWKNFPPNRALLIQHGKFPNEISMFRIRLFSLRRFKWEYPQGFLSIKQKKAHTKESHDIPGFCERNFFRAKNTVGVSGNLGNFSGSFQMIFMDHHDGNPAVIHVLCFQRDSGRLHALDVFIRVGVYSIQLNKIAHLNTPFGLPAPPATTRCSPKENIKKIIKTYYELNLTMSSRKNYYYQ